MTGCDPWIGKRLGKYAIVRALGRGAMGIVYEAEDTRLQRPVALKLLPESLARDEAVVKRFLLEARAAARLSHPNVVAVYDIGQRDGTYYLALELVRGVNLKQVLATRGPLPWADATWVCAEVCRGLIAAHAADLIHRDIKPSNILVAGAVVKIADFGLAKFTTQNFPRLTKLHSTVGTPAYMSPEQCRNEPVDALSDVYSLGATYFALLTGRPPYSEGDDMNALAAHCTAPVPDPRQHRQEIPAACAAVAMRAMGKTRTDRYTGAQEMLGALTAALGASQPSMPMLPYAPQPAADSQTKTSPMHPAPMPLPQRRHWRRLVFVTLPLLLVPVLACTGLIALLTWRAGRDAAHLAKDAPPGAPQGLAALPPQPEPVVVSLRPLKKLDGHPPSVVGLAFRPDGKRLISVGKLSARVWDITSGAMTEPITHTKTVTAMALFPKGDRLALATDDRLVYLSTINAAQTRGFGPMKGEGVSMAVSPDAQWLAVGTGGDLQVWNIADQPQRRYVYPNTQDHVSAVAFSNDGKALAWVNHQREVHVVETTTWQSRGDVVQQPGELSCVTFTADGNSVIYGGRDAADPGRGVLQRWDFARDGEKPRALSLGKAGGVRALALLPGGRELLYGGHGGGSIRLHDMKQDRSRTAAVLGQTAVQALAVSADGKLVAGGMDNGAIEIWEVIAEPAAKAP